MTEPLPDDLAKPREEWRERASFWANIIVAGVLGLIALCMFIYALTT